MNDRDVALDDEITDDGEVLCLAAGEGRQDEWSDLLLRKVCLIDLFTVLAVAVLGYFGEDAELLVQLLIDQLAAVNQIHN